MIEHTSVRGDVVLAPFTTYKVGGTATWFAEPRDLEELRSVLELVPGDVEIAVLGRGSNLVISDDGFDGLVLRLGGAFGAIGPTPDGCIVAGAGAALPKLARVAASEGMAGLEFFVGIPGSVGGAVAMNAGGHGSDTGTANARQRQPPRRGRRGAGTTVWRYGFDFPPHLPRPGRGHGHD